MKIEIKVYTAWSGDGLRLCLGEVSKCMVWVWVTDRLSHSICSMNEYIIHAYFCIPLATADVWVNAGTICRLFKCCAKYFFFLLLILIFIYVEPKIYSRIWLCSVSGTFHSHRCMTSVFFSDVALALKRVCPLIGLWSRRRRISSAKP